MSKKMVLIGVAGTAGAGKDVASQLLTELFGAQNMSTGDLVRAVTRHIYGLAPDFNPVRDQLFQVANFLRAVDPAFTVKTCIFQAEQQGIERVLLSGLRSMGEADAIRAAGGTILALDADPKVRYERIYQRGRDSESQKSYEEFLEQDAYENKGLADSGPGRGIQHIIQSADIVIHNSSSTLDSLRAELQERLGPLFQ